MNGMLKTKLLLSALICYQHNFRMLHWKAKGKHFDRLHEMMDEYYEKFGEYIDVVAEILLMHPDDDINPPSLSEAVGMLESSETKFLILDPKDNFDLDDGFEVIVELLNSSIVLLNDAKSELPESISSAYDEIIYWLYLESQYKMKRRL